MPDTDRSAPARSGAPTLLAVAHGTRDPAGGATIQELVERVRRLRPGLVTRLAYLEAVLPSLQDSVTILTGPVVVLPLLLAHGYHAAVDIPRTVAARPARTPGRETRVGAVLGPHRLLADALADRLREAGWRRGDAVVLGAAGSTDPAAAAATEAQVTLLAELLGEPVVAAYAAAAVPSVPDAIDDLRTAGADRVVVASYLLAPGLFHSRLATSGADAVSAPLGSHDAVARLVLARYDEARLAEI